MVVVGEVLVGAIISKLVGTAYDYISNKVQDRVTRSNMYAEVDKLKANLRKIQAVLLAAEKTGITLDEMEPDLSAWMWQLRDASDAADILLDDIEYQKLDKEFELEENNGLTEVDPGYESDSKGVKMYCGAFISKCTMKKMKHVFIDDPILVRLRDVVKELDEVASHVGEFVQLVAFSEQCASRDTKCVEIAKDREAGFLPTENNLFGRAEEKEELTKWLLRSRSTEKSESKISLSVLAIIGVGGIGKTTLAQDIYNDDSVDDYFSKKIWICVSNTFDVPTILGKIVRTSEQTLSILQEEVQKKLSLEKFLLVLDDVWDDEHRDRWENLVALLQYGKFGSKVVLTTRMNSVAKMVKDVMEGSDYLQHNLKGLDNEMSTHLLDKYVFAHVNIANYSNFQPITMKIAEKLGGVPLLLKAMGGVLSSNLDYGRWIGILNSNAMNLEMNDNKVLNVLKLSYQNLSIQVQKCFLFCSTFPEDYYYTKEELVGMWVALGMIPQYQNGHEQPKDVGKEYFNILVRKSFLIARTYGYEYYVMHDCMHHMASIISRGEYFAVNNIKSIEIPKTTRHLFIKSKDVSLLVDMCPPRNLQTLIMENFDRDEELPSIISRFFERLTNLRVLKIRWHEVHDLPIANTNLHHLRYVDICIGSSTLRRLPNCFGKLYHLQVMNLGFTGIKDAFVNVDNPIYGEITMHGAFLKLRKLKHIRIRDHINGEWSPVFFSGIGKLTLLEEIAFNLKDEDGYKLSELKNMNNLNSSLEIVGLEKVRNSEEAKEAKLADKKHLSSLKLEWKANDSRLRDNRRQESDAELANFLKPPCNVNTLTIKGYEGLRPPCWLEIGYLKHLVSISFIDCGVLSQLPDLGSFYFIKFLKLQNVPFLKQMPPLPLSLENLTLSGVGLVSLPTILIDHESTSLIASASLSSLVISDCPNLRSLAEGLFRQQNLLTALKELHITKCKELVVTFPDVGFGSLISLRFLRIEFNQSPEIIPSMPANLLPLSLNELIVYGQVEGVLHNLLRGLTSLLVLKLVELNITPHSQQNYSLKVTIGEVLEINESGKLKSLDNLYVPTSLQRLTIEKCPNLELVAFLIEDNQSSSSSALEEINISSCDELRSIENLYGLISVQNIYIVDCPNLVSINNYRRSESDEGIVPSTVNNLKIKDCATLASLSFMVGLISVKSLIIFNCPNLPTGAVLEENSVTNVGQRFSKDKDNILSVTNLYLGCASLLLCHPLRKITSVQNLWLKPHLHPIPESFLLQNRTSLTNISLCNSSHLEFLHDLTVLKGLYISGAMELKTLPELPRSLERLYIYGCTSEFKRLYMKNTGENWPKISFIPDVHIAEGPR